MHVLGHMHLVWLPICLEVYVRKQAQCLLDVEGDGDSSHASLIQLQQWSLEMSALWSCFGIGGPHNISEWHSGSLEDQGLIQNPARRLTPHELLSILDYSEQQISDMLHLRRLFHGKLGQLARERNDLLSRMADETSVSPLRRFDIDFKNIAARLAETQDLSKRLCANRAEENCALIYCGIGLYLCIQTSVQYAKAMVHMYPYVLKKQDLLESLAAQQGEPSMEALSESAGVGDLQHSSNWESVVQYVANVDAKGVHGHFPLIKFLQKAC